MTKNRSKEILSKELKPIALENIQFENRHTTLIEHLCIFSLSTFQSKGDIQKLFHPRNNQKDVTVNSDPDERIQKNCYRENRGGISKYFNTNRNFATFGQSEIQVRRKRPIS